MTKLTLGFKGWLVSKLVLLCGWWEMIIIALKIKIKLKKFSSAMVEEKAAAKKCIKKVKI
jgi:hypothetical protein